MLAWIRWKLLRQAFCVWMPLPVANLHLLPNKVTFPHGQVFLMEDWKQVTLLL